MDFFGQIHAMNYSAARMQTRQRMRAQRQALIYDRIGEAIGPSRVAQTVWALEARDPNDAVGSPIGMQHPGQAAMIAVRNAIAEYHLPVDFKTRYLGMERFSGRGAHDIEDGVVNVELAFRSLSGVDRVVDVPVRVMAGRVLEPVVLVDRGVHRAITQSTFDDLVRQGTFMTTTPVRKNLYSPPPDERQLMRAVPIVRPGMFGVAPINKQLTAAYVVSAMRGHYVTALPDYQAMRDDPPDHVDIGEQPPPAIAPGDTVKLKKAVDFVGRDGQRWHVASGTSGEVQRDMEGDGRFYAVWFDELHRTLRVSGDLIKK